MRYLIALLLAVTPALAQEVPLAWDRQDVDDLDIIRVKWDEQANGSSWGSAPFSADFDGQSNGGTVTVGDYCVLYRFAVKTRDTGGNVSPTSNAVDAYATPIISSVSPASIPRDNSWHVVTVTGSGFVDGGDLVVTNVNVRGEFNELADVAIDQYQVDSCTQLRVSFGARYWAELRDVTFRWRNPDGGKVRFVVTLTDAEPQPDDGEPPPALELKRR